MSNDTYAISKIVGTSKNSIEEAIENGIKSASETVRDMNWFEVISTRGYLSDGKVEYYQVTIEFGFKVRRK